LSSSDDVQSGKLEKNQRRDATDFIELSCGFAQLALKEYILSPKAGKRKVRSPIYGGTPFAQCAMDCGQGFQRRAGWEKVKQNVNGLNRSECEIEVTCLFGPAVSHLHSREFAIQKAVDAALGHNNRQLGLDFHKSLVFPSNILSLLTYFKNLIARNCGIFVTGAHQSNIDTDVRNHSAEQINKKSRSKRKDSRHSSGSESGDSSDNGLVTSERSKPLCDPNSIRVMFTQLMGNPGILRRILVDAWDTWNRRDSPKKDKIDADAFENLDADNSGVIDAEEFKRFFQGENEVTRLERVFDNMIIKAFTMLVDQTKLQIALLTSRDTASSIGGNEFIQAELKLLLDALTSEDIINHDFVAFGGGDSSMTRKDGQNDRALDNGEKREERPFSLSEIHSLLT
jgi:hypothetical protein